MPKAIDLTGLVVGKLTVISCVSAGSNGVHAKWRCLCSCGNESVVRSSRLLRSKTQSCGCLQLEVATTHGGYEGGAESKTHRVWRGMIERCSNPKDSHWINYGARGIKVCERWQVFESFIADMGEKPPQLSIERINNDGGYSPENCIWADGKTQSRNRRSTPFITLCGERLPLIAACERYDVGYHSVHARKARAEESVIEAFLHVFERKHMDTSLLGE